MTNPQTAHSDNVTVVFVHGINSSADTWDRLRATMANDPGLATVAELPFSYEARPIRRWGFKRSPTQADVAVQLKTYLDAHVPDHHQIVFIAHSQGGLIVQRLLADTVQDGRAAELARVRAVVLLACPNGGSQTLQIARKFARPLLTPQERSLQALDQEIQRVRAVVLERCVFATDATPTTCPVPFWVYAGADDGIVPPASADGLFPRRVVGSLPGDHSTMLDITDQGQTSYRRIVHHITTPRSSAVTTQQVDATEDKSGGQVKSSAPTRQPAQLRAIGYRLRLTLGDQPLVGRVSNGHLRLDHGSHADPEVLVAADGCFVAHRDSERLHVARVNRVTGAVAVWHGSIELTDLDAGVVLAVGAAGPSDLAFVWATRGGTDLYLARHHGAPPRRVAHLSDECASSAVLHGIRALLVLPTHVSGSQECTAFPDVDVTSMVAASAAGRTLVLAIGRDAGGQVGAWVEFDGRKRARVAEPDAFLQLGLGSRNPPVVVASDGHALSLSPEVEGSPSYDHWVPKASSGKAASA